MLREKDGKVIAILIPVYNEANALEENFEVIYKQLEEDNVIANILLIDDGSTDLTWKVAEDITAKYEGVSALKFSRNFGKEIALSAGIDSIDADLYLLMDSDLQHPPRHIRSMLELMATSDADIVEGIKSSRGKESLKYKVFAKTFYKLLHKMTKLDLDNSSDFKLMTREVADSIRDFTERNVFFRGVIDWVGYNKVQLPFEVEERVKGTSHFSTIRLMNLAINAVLSYTSQPLYLTIFIGSVFLFFALILGTQTLYNYLSGTAVDGFSTVILLILITGSMLMMSLGVIGVYISRIYDEVKNRPRYIIQKKTDDFTHNEDEIS